MIGMGFRGERDIARHSYAQAREDAGLAVQHLAGFVKEPGRRCGRRRGFAAVIRG